MKYYHWPLVVIGFDTADKIWLAVTQDFHQLLQGLFELPP